MKTCAITGHRFSRFKFKLQDTNTACKRLKKRLHDQFVLLYEQGVRTYIIGGDLGVDIWSGEILLEMKKLPEYSELELIIALPFPEHDRNWHPLFVRRLEYLKRSAKEVVTVGREPGAVSYKRRNYYMIDRADVLVAVYDNDHSVRNPIGQSVNYAKKRELPIILIHPDKGTVSYER